MGTASIHEGVRRMRFIAEGGGLISYGPYLTEEYRRGASYADRLLKVRSRASFPSRLR
jgi:putative tryptophan/tyrosine transport system substrate-binding protein